jgi:hypothetical protein
MVEKLPKNLTEKQATTSSAQEKEEKILKSDEI